MMCELYQSADRFEIADLMIPAQVPAGIVKPTNKINVPLGTILHWKPGNASYQHDVYFGTNYDAVANAMTSSPEYQGRQSAATVTFDPGTLNPLTHYYWRIDEVNEGAIIPGDVWDFRRHFRIFQTI